MAENSPVREWVSTAGRQGYWYLPFIIPAASGMCDCICLKSLKVFVGMSVVRRIHISSSVDSLLCLPLVSLFYISYCTRIIESKVLWGIPSLDAEFLGKLEGLAGQLLPCPTSEFLQKLGPPIVKPFTSHTQRESEFFMRYLEHVWVHHLYYLPGRLLCGKRPLPATRRL